MTFADGSLLREIDDNAFNGCYNLKNICLPQNLRNIGKYCFCGCGFTSINIPKSVERIERRAFYDC